MDVDVVVMGYLPSGWDSGDEATGPQMDEITTVVLARWPTPERVRSPAPTTPAARRGSQCLDGLRACSCCCAPNNTYTGDPPSGLTTRGTFLGWKSNQEVRCDV